MKIKTNTVKLLLGDLKMSDKEIAQQKARIEKVKADAEKDDHDTRAQVHAPPRRRAALLARAAQRACPRANCAGGRARRDGRRQGERGRPAEAARRGARHLHGARRPARAGRSPSARAHAPTRTRARRSQMSKKDALSATDEWGAGVEKLKAACAMLAENGHPGVVYDAC